MSTIKKLQYTEKAKTSFCEETRQTTYLRDDPYFRNVKRGI